MNQLKIKNIPEQQVLHSVHLILRRTQISGIIFYNKYYEVTPTTELLCTEMSKCNLRLPMQWKQ